MVDHVVLGRHDLAEADRAHRLGDRSLHQQDPGARGHDVSPFDVEGGLAGPAGHGRVVGVERRDLAYRLDHFQPRLRQMEGPVKGGQVVGDGGRPEGVDDGDRLAGAVHSAPEQASQLVGPLYLGRLVAGDREHGFALSRRERSPR